MNNDRPRRFNAPFHRFRTGIIEVTSVEQGVIFTNYDLLFRLLKMTTCSKQRKRALRRDTSHHFLSLHRYPNAEGGPTQPRSSSRRKP